MTTPTSAQFMTATELATLAPLGAVIRFSDFTPAPPLRFKRKHDEWSRNNSQGRLISVTKGKTPSETTFTLHMGDYGANGVVVIASHKTFMGYSALRFAIHEQPSAGSVGVIDIRGECFELLHLAGTKDAAEDWRAQNNRPTAALFTFPLLPVHAQISQ